MSNREKITLGQELIIEWRDSYGATSVWSDLEDYKAETLVIKTYGRVVFIDEEKVAVAGNYATATENTPEQANGIMVIPMSCIIRVTSFSSSCLEPG